MSDSARLQPTPSNSTSADLPFASSRRRALRAAVLALSLTSAASAWAAVDLMEVFEIALSSDPAFLAAGAGNRAAQEGRVQARAALLPNARLTASLIGNDQEVRQSTFSPRSRPSFQSTDIELAITQPIYRKELWISLEQSDLSIQQANVQYASARQDLMLRTAEAYFTVLRALDERSFAQATQQAFEQQLKQSQQRFEVGLIAVTDVEEAKSGFDRARADVIAADNALDNAEEAMREITGQYHQALALLGREAPLVVPEPADIDAWTETALRQNLDLLAARFASDRAQDEIGRQQSRHLPTLDLVGRYVNSSSGGVFGDSETRTSSIGFQLVVPIYEGGGILSTTRESRHLYQQSVDEVEQARRSAQRQTRNAYLGIESGIAQVQALGQAVRSAESALESIEAGFQVGTRTSVDVLNATRDLFRAKRDHALARYDYIIDILNLKQAAGTLSEADLLTINRWLQ